MGRKSERVSFWCNSILKRVNMGVVGNAQHFTEKEWFLHVSQNKWTT